MLGVVMLVVYGCGWYNLLEECVNVFIMFLKIYYFNVEYV